ncbi:MULTISPECIES: 3-hydroxy-9,10-secoandrosta-1,3,5(10)-triene-9,17-dione monooxygenase reductase subunit [Prauserella salsuginis group]|uniref:3-hydroxy-9,10-secoandrosta-1,3,5(10)-triene-9, 17-dione monooxygenase reductase subunit n=1 Tax=Prauserella salsuginis TaxID=387889 RepID=A0ABW6G2Z1_9PSEU|nr:MULTISPECIES: 3-hydroxy-9,10-secoandrosta-1,3,5(10)-triene-9,17-dione monooxygenase reductase subunit [Prauserella salsuginis group]MCR3718455.1 3-hydroxy-9,10-secoandrosta-1,3,5(10)-triene-9,17-dione monooxygenase reductase component [Prauserella flava]MCR3733025.1 3-hydroxy-9,10-secoandrosta-1,3,5(10)-triene-9,17-dione monooxygenase reductase component [Prauserella salsuginis]
MTSAPDAVDSTGAVDSADAVDVSARFRSVLGHFCTGVAIVTACEDGEPVGFACQSFTALSLEPPLVLFCPARTSGTWPVIERVGRFAVNVLAGEQRDVSAVFGSRGADKFSSVSWTPAPSGSPLLDGALTWVDCAVETVHEAGDHYVVIGRVVALGEASARRPLLFYRGGYTVTEAAPDAMPGGPRPDDWF